MKLKVNIAWSRHAGNQRWNCKLKLRDRARACVRRGKRKRKESAPTMVKEKWGKLRRQRLEGSTWITFTSVNCWEIKRKSTRPYETRNNCARRSFLYFTFVRCSRLHVRLQRNAETHTVCRCSTSEMETYLLVESS